MQFITPTCYWKEQEKGIEGVYGMMTFAGRLTHNCESKTDGAEDYVNRMIRLGHGRVFEFGTIYMVVRAEDDPDGSIVDFFANNPYSRVHTVVTPVDEDNVEVVNYITTNYRVLLQGETSTWTKAIRSQYSGNMLRCLKFMTEDNNPVIGYHYLRHTIVWDFGNSRATMDSFRTHTGLSSLMMSTRYCKFSSPKYGNSLAISRPYWLIDPIIEDKKDYRANDIKKLYIAKKIGPDTCAYIEGLCDDERRYFGLTLGSFYDEDFKPWAAERARGLLGLDVATKMIQCGYEDEWIEFFRQRAIPEEGAHPDAQYISNEAIKLLGDNDFVTKEIKDLHE